MKIIVASAFFPPVATGSSHFSSDVAQAYADAGHEVLVVTATPPPDSVNPDDFENGVYRLAAHWLRLGSVSFNYQIPFTFRSSNVRNVLRIFRDFKPDIVHINSQLFDLSLLVAVAAMKHRVPKVVTIHTPLIHTNRLLHWLMALCDRFFIGPLLTAGSSKIVGVDKFTVDLYSRRYGTQAKPTSFIPATFVQPRLKSGDHNALAKMLGLDGKRVILSLGHVIPIRSRIPLILALPKIREQIPNVAVLIVGEIFDDRFLKLASELGVGDAVFTTGRVAREDVGDYISLADIECHDLDGHGLGITTLEAMSLGVPIFATVNDEVFPGTGILNNEFLHIRRRDHTLDIAGEIVSLLRVGNIERDLIIEAQKYFVESNFSSEIVSSSYLKLFEELIV